MRPDKKIVPNDSLQKMKVRAFQMQRSLLVRFQPVSSLSDYNAPLLVEMTNAFKTVMPRPPKLDIDV